MITGRHVQGKRRALNALPDCYKADTGSLHGRDILSAGIRERGGTAMTAGFERDELPYAGFANAPPLRGAVPAIGRRLRKQQRREPPMWRDAQSAAGLSLPLACLCLPGPPSDWYTRYWLQDQAWPDLACSIGGMGKRCARFVSAALPKLGAGWLRTLSRQPLRRSRDFRST